jgi:hypothetical protein
MSLGWPIEEDGSLSPSPHLGLSHPAHGLYQPNVAPKYSDNLAGFRILVPRFRTVRRLACFRPGAIRG